MTERDWALVYDGWEPAKQGLREALCTLGNGYFATRGAAPDVSADSVHYPGTYLAGGYNRAVSRIGDRDVENEDLVNFPNWLCLTFRIGDGDWFRFDQLEVLSYRQELNLHDGVLLRTLRCRDAAGRTTRWTERRLVSMANRHLAALSVRIEPEDWDGQIQIRSAVDATVQNTGVPRYRELESRHFDVLETRRAGDDLIVCRVRTRQSRLELVEALRTRVRRDGELLDARRGSEESAEAIAELIETEVSAGTEVEVEKVVALRTSRDRASAEPALEAERDARNAGSFDELAEEHRRAWHHLWDEFDLALEAAGEHGTSSQLKLRVHVFHLLQTVSLHSTDLDVGVPARGWHGEAYRGHVFWDELFIFPLLTARMPVLTRALLQYRYRRLREARRAAAEAGLRGAMFPWQSGSNGREESQRLHLNPESGRWIPDDSHRQRHINAAIAYNVWSYYQVTEDHDFLYFYGAEMLLEIARFWASIARYDEVHDRYDILGVMGPDEYHTGYPGAEQGGLDNNAYTNLMAAWVLTRVRDVLAVVPEHRCRKLCETLGVTTEELEHWEDISKKLRVCFHGDGIISQFAGYGELEELDWVGLRERHGDVQRLDRILEAEDDSTNRYKASKQADVLMLFYLFSADELRLLFEQLGYAFDKDLIPRNIEYYMARTSHGSTLSRVTHAWVLARSDRRASWKHFQEALDSDVADVQGGTTPEGIHVGAMAGTVDLVHRCYTGIETRANVLHFDPVLPHELESLRLELRYRRHLLEVDITHDKLRVSSRPSTAFPITIAYRGHFRDLSPGSRYEFRLLTPEERVRDNGPASGRC